MAADWIKIEHTLPTKPEVFGIARRVGLCRTDVVGRLVLIWSWIDEITDTGIDLRIAREDIDALAGMEGFAEAMRAEGWLGGQDGSLQVPNFTRHNGKSAKARALEAEAKRLRRSSDNMSDNCRTNSSVDVRPEKRKRRDKIKTKDLPQPLPANSLAADSVEEEGGWIEAALRSRGLAATDTAVQTIRDRELSPAFVRGVLAHFDRQAPAWQPGAIFTCLRRALRDDDPTNPRLWPEPSDEWQRYERVAKARQAAVDSEAQRAAQRQRDADNRAAEQEREQRLGAAFDALDDRGLRCLFEAAIQPASRKFFEQQLASRPIAGGLRRDLLAEFDRLQRCEAR